MIQLIALIIFLVSTLGIIFILFKKSPELVKLPQNGSSGIKKHKIISDIEDKIRHHHFHLFEKQMLLHKFLSWIKVMTLKTEVKIDVLLHGIRKKAQQIDKEANG
ncbi:MAG: hypothetical protein Q7S77_00575, partial [Candidatus Staskawiczbacteria bacterium]|nr:hypothetical protein [Candidatus Staskawiczbacteria bacterium]